MKKHRWLASVGLASLCLLWFAFTLTASSDMNQDLGRHLKIGETILKQLRIPDTNLFSYTNPDYRFINHHWLFEVLTYLLQIIGGIRLLIVLKSAVIVIASAIAWWVAARKSSPVAALAASLVVAPFLLERSTIRPEIIGYVLFTLMLWLVYDIRPNDRRIWIVPALLFIWVNSHITFVFGILLSILIGLRIIRMGYSWTTIGSWTAITSVALLLNPHGFNGLIYPFFIYRDYGYTIVENQNIFFLAGAIHNPLIDYLAIISPIIITTAGILIYRQRYVEAFILSLFCCLAVWQIRHLPFFMLAAITPLSVAFSIIGSLSVIRNNRIYLYILFIAVSLVMAFAGILNVYQRRVDNNATFGLEVHEDGRAAADYMLANNLPAPMFNNFDIGGYAIYRLYPRYKVFVDNRPEAYPSDFFTYTYIALQENDAKQAEVFNQYGVRTIFFAHTDQTPWARTFITRILKDTQWKLVYLDASVFIMTADQLRTDIREHKQYLENLIHNQTGYLKLMQLAAILWHIDEKLAMKAYGKATLENPVSCTIIRNQYQQQVANSLFGSPEQVKRDNWLCF